MPKTAISSMVLVLLASILLASYATAQDTTEQVTAKTSASEITPQRLTALPPESSTMPADPQFLVNVRQADLRDHHLSKAPTPTGPPLPEAAFLAIDKGPATEVLPLDAGADSPVVFTRNRDLDDTETGGVTSTVNEPSVAAARNGVVLYTANWFAAISKDDGESFTFRNPSLIFPETDGHFFCCDQVVLYDPTHDILFWFLQYTQNGSSNKIRLAYALGEDIQNEIWSYYDFTPQAVGGWNNEWFDFPDLALSQNHLYITLNSFSTQGTFSTEDDGFARAVIMRLPLSEIAESEPASVQYYDTQVSFSFRPTQGAQEVMYFGSHDFTNFGQSIQIYAWPENSNQITLRRIQVDPWSNMGRTSVAADGNQWLRRTDYRMTAAWVQDNEVGFAWSAAADGNFPQPHVRVAIINVGDVVSSPVAQPHIWNNRLAFAYPYASVNISGTLGISIAYGGGGQGGVNPSHAVGVLRKIDTNYTWQLIAAGISSSGPADGRWGDYLSIKPHGQDPELWVASGYTLQGGSLPANVVPKVVYFREPGVEPIIVPQTGAPYGAAALAPADAVFVNNNGNVGIGTTNPQTKLDVAGATRTEVIEVTGGADIAELFQVAGMVEIQPGMVVVLDPEHPGQLRIADSAYDPLVAGVISGAGEIQAGLLLQQQEFISEQLFPIALTGKVYVQAIGPIAVGDLLTSSDVAGHAMAATEREQAFGATLGKAMSSLEEGAGLVLMLVSLQ